MKAQIELDINGFPLQVEAQFLVNEWTENYREDIDGNRGVKTTFRDITSLCIFDCMGNDLKEKLETRYPEQYEKVIDAIMEVEID